MIFWAYFSKNLTNPAFNFCAFRRKTLFAWNFWENFPKNVLRKLLKMDVWAYFSKNLWAFHFCAFGRKTQILWKFWEKFWKDFLRSLMHSLGRPTGPLAHWPTFFPGFLSRTAVSFLYPSILSLSHLFFSLFMRSLFMTRYVGCQKNE